MRKYHKNQCIELLNSIEEAHKQIAKALQKRNIEEASSLLEDCQRAAIQVGTTIDTLEGEGTEAVHILEDYCEYVYGVHEKLSTEERINERQFEKKFKKIINKAKNEIRNGLTTQYEAVFLPYIASMWDSLESIWMAANEDENCNAYVIPIPYYDKISDGSFKDIHYEGNMYPKYVPIANYTQYSLEKHHPDVIFIHNPYDDWNYVTSVHPDYYSKDLKQYTDCLVYVPYYVTTGIMSEGQAFCPAYVNSDYIVVQNKDIISQFDKRIPRDKFLPLGSPKIDRISDICKAPVKPPADWAGKMEGKKVFFYNTSIAGLLEDTGRFLRKMAYVFNVFSSYEDACVLWRPHPLLESTLESMRPGFLFVYELLKQSFVAEDIGIFDTTSDIEHSISLCDAYIGDGGSSVLALFEVTNKQVYILDNSITDKQPEDWWKAYYFYCLRQDGNNEYCVINGKDLYKAEIKDKAYDFHFFKSIADKLGQYMDAAKMNNKLFVLPFSDENILVTEEDGSSHKIRLKNYKINEDAFFFGYLIYEDYIVLLPNYYPDLVRINTKTEEADYIQGVRDYAVVDDGNTRIYKCRLLYQGKLWLMDKNGTEFRIIDILTMEEEIKKNPFRESIGAVTVAHDKEKTIWNILDTGTEIEMWNTITGNIEKFDLYIEGLNSIDRDSDDRGKSDKRYFKSVVPFGGNYIFTPDWGNKFVELNIQTKEAREWKPPFEFTTEDRDEYFTNNGMGFFWYDDEADFCHFWNGPERKNCMVDMKRRVYKEIDVNFSEKDIGRYQDGFVIAENGNQYQCMEGGLNTLSSIINGEISGNKYELEVQEKLARKMNASYGKNCGEQVYQTIIEKLS